MFSYWSFYYNRSICSYIKSVVSIILMCSLFLHSVNAGGEVVWAVNCGGDEHTDSQGIHYQADPLDVGQSSDFGRNMYIQRVGPQDQLLYQTERYHVNTFGYELPVYKDGDYVLVLKFSEVWFAAPNQKVFDVVLNGEHTIVSELDIFSRVGRGVAHDEIIPFSIRGGKLHVNDETSQIDGNKILLEFIKGDLDNPKVNAIYVIKGTVDDVPKLPPIPNPDQADHDVVDEDEDAGDDEGSQPKKAPRKPSGPKVRDPYAAEDTSTMLLPVFIAIGAFIPLVYCLCKLQ
ncbi:unnamed protein product [Candidula unifasciata]|uniref:Malectin domain-containing protein n=1 Tax=Candidula unifasciata TaxID=100452 RepID=A0A8S3ZVP2_9EUPU|nr:unnamed protein product [Candidula unifasciata]